MAKRRVMKAVSSVLAARARTSLARTSAFGAFVAEHRVALTRVAVSEGLTHDEALDAIQDAALILLRRYTSWWRKEWQPEEARRLLVTLVRNTARNARRRHWRNDAALDEVPEEVQLDAAARSLDEALAEAQTHVAVTGCLSTLKEVQRVVVMARFFDGSTGAQVATELGLTEGHVAVTLHRARRRLRACVEASAFR